MPRTRSRRAGRRRPGQHEGGVLGWWASGPMQTHPREDRHPPGVPRAEGYRAGPARLPSEVVRPVHPAESDEDAEGGEEPPRPPEAMPGGGHRREGEHERDRVERVAIAVLEPAAAVVEEVRDEGRDRRQPQSDREWPGGRIPPGSPD